MGLLDLTDECKLAIDRWNGVVGPPDPRNRGTKRLRVFKNDFVENVLATSHPALPIVWFGGIIAYGAWSAWAIGPEVGLPCSRSACSAGRSWSTRSIGSPSTPDRAPARSASSTGS